MFLADHDRPLAPRGKKAAKVMASWMLAHAVQPDLVLCSTATRCQQTLKRLTKLMAVPVTWEPKLYHAEPEVILAQLSHLNPNIKSVMIVGHNPGFEALVLQLTQSHPDPDTNPFLQTDKIMPTAALAEFSWQGDWEQPMTARIALEQIIRPREVMATQ